MTIAHNAEKQSGQSVLLPTVSTREQERTELECQPFFVNLATLPPSQLQHLRDTGLLASDSLDICLLTEQHLAYLEQVWKQNKDDRPQLRPSFVSLDSSRTWMLYWSLHSCDLLGYEITDEDACAIVLTIRKCFSPVSIRLPKALVDRDPVLQSVIQHPTDDDPDDTVSLPGGGFGGGIGQMAHAATSYAAVLVLCILSSRHNKAALALLQQVRLRLYVWMVSLQEQEDGSMRMHHDGEVDVRATYCVVAVAKLLNLLTPSLNHDKTAAFVAKCQTWEGGFGGEPFAEAHGGYTYCAIAALQLLGRVDTINLPALAGYLSRRQMPLEGGFNGRANKLVDGCYSFWQGGAMAIVSALICQNEDDSAALADPWLSSDPPTSLLYDQGMLMRYILLCAQDIHGGLRDKPSKNRDHYHSCYNLSGLSVAQHYGEPKDLFGHPSLSSVARTHPCYNIRVEHAQFCLRHFASADGS